MNTDRLSSTGILVLGMHRSGTSSLTRVLNLGGADLGSRVTGASPGNETGHWEDAFAIETHEQLLAALGRRWDDAAPLPAGWADTEAAAVARRAIRGYLDADRSRHSLWAVKDPRLSLFASLWLEAASELALPVSTVMVLRHPMEVADSLSARDGIAQGRGLLLWLEHTVAAVQVAETMPNVVVGYEQLVADWKQVVARVRTLPGASQLDYDARTAAAVDEFLDAGLRHHRHQEDAGMPRVVAQAWELVSGFARQGNVEPGSASRLAEVLGDVRELINPVFDEAKAANRILWERVWRSEAIVVDLAHEVRAAHAVHFDAVSNEVLGLRSVVEDGTQMTQGLAGRFELQDQQLAAIQTQISGVREAVDATLAPTLQHALVGEMRTLTDVLVTHQQAAHDAVSGAFEAIQQRAAGVEQELAKVVELLPRHEQVLAQLGEARATAATDRRRADEAAAELADVRRELAAELARAQEATRCAVRAAAEANGRIAELEAAGEERHKSDLQAAADAQARVEQQVLQIAMLKFEVEELRDQAQQLERVKASRSWRWTRPARAMARLLTGNFTDTDRARVRKLAQKGPKQLSALVRTRLGQEIAGSTGGPLPADLHASEAELAQIAIAPQRAGLPDIFVWAVIDWHFRFQRPQHLARALADKGHRVFYMSNNFVDRAEPGFHVEPLGADGRLFQVHLNVDGKPPIYFGMPDQDQVEAMRASLATVLQWSCTTGSVSLVQHPFWSPLVRAVPSSRVVYDCMDHHGGFENNAPSVLKAESKLVSDADLVIVTSGWLENEIAPKARSTAMVRNAGEYAFFKDPPAKVFRDEDGRRVIGYYGAIAEWFDAALVRRVAEALPDALVLLVGNDTAEVGVQLADLPNVKLTGEVRYADLPYWLHGFDVCLLPFQVIPLTLATNPVKVYEYLAAGKPVVCVDLPEMTQFSGLVRVASDADGFVGEVAAALGESPEQSCAERQNFAAEQTWDHRAETLDAALATLAEPRVSVVVLTFNNLAFTDACLFSLEAYSDYSNLEVIVVDNASSDGSPEWLQRWAAEPSAAGHTRRLILNESNVGFSAGNNVGMRAATGDVIILLNNDTYVTPGWVRGLCNHLREEPSLGLVGPVTNNIGNEARIPIAYADMADMIRAAGAFTRANPGVRTPMRTAAFFCVAMRREVYERIGDMDEAFGVGFFEDDDYSRRIEAAGFTIACADDVFVHHHLSASFDALKAGTKQALFDRNKAIYEAKWGSWEPHTYRS